MEQLGDCSPQIAAQNQEQRMQKEREFTLERALELAATHGRCEYDHNIAGVMSTIGDEPFWEFHPLGMRVDGRDAIRTMYEYELDNLLPNIVGSTVRLVGLNDLSLMREATYVIRLPDGGQGTGLAAICFEFQANGLLISERVYASGALVALVESCFPSSIWRVPGVSHIGI
jgi:hypothetical protein